MKKAKLNLKQLHIQSFVTEEQKTEVKGGEPMTIDGCMTIAGDSCQWYCTATPWVCYPSTMHEYC